MVGGDVVNKQNFCGAYGSYVWLKLKYIGFIHDKKYFFYTWNNQSGVY